MPKRFSQFLGTAAIYGLLLLPLASIMQGATIAYSISNATGNDGTFNFTFGFEFQANASILVTQLGIFDSSQDGLAEAHQVGIWTGSGILLGSNTIPNGTAAPLVSQFRYEPLLVPVALTAGQQYVIAASYPTNGDSFVFGASGLASTPDISIIIGRGGASGFAFPSIGCSATTGCDASYFGPNFQFTQTETVPEPSSLTLLLLVSVVGIIGLSARRSADSSSASFIVIVWERVPVKGKEAVAAIELAKTAQSEFPRVPILFLSSAATTECELNQRVAGCVFVQKPTIFSNARSAPDERSGGRNGCQASFPKQTIAKIRCTADRALFARTRGSYILIPFAGSRRAEGSDTN